LRKDRIDEFDKVVAEAAILFFACLIFFLHFAYM